MLDPISPDAVVFAESTRDVQDAVTLCQQYLVPVIAYGTGSSLEGHLLPLYGGISLDVSRMTKVIAINAEDLTATVEAGVTREALNAALKDSGLFFPPIDPGADASLGGMGRDARFRHQCSSLRHHARERRVAARHHSRG